LTQHADIDTDWPPADADDGGDTDLRSKYLDYCSARISEIFLALSDDRIYDMMEEAAREAGLDPGELGYRTQVRLVTEKLRDSVPLPEMEEWVREYREDPERFEPYLLGLDRSPVERLCGSETEGGEERRPEGGDGGGGAGP
jgi:hypothetical protein